MPCQDYPDAHSEDDTDSISVSSADSASIETCPGIGTSNPVEKALEILHRVEGPGPSQVQLIHNVITIIDILSHGTVDDVVNFHIAARPQFDPATTTCASIRAVVATAFARPAGEAAPLHAARDLARGDVLSVFYPELPEAEAIPAFMARSSLNTASPTFTMKGNGKGRVARRLTAVGRRLRCAVKRVLRALACGAASKVDDWEMELDVYP
jgi:hypothetical protein